MQVAVSSGMGWHVYWRLRDELETPRWKALAQSFGAFLKAKGMDVDTSRTADASSVLRLPGTLHQKSGRQVEVALDTLSSYGEDELYGIFGTQAPVQIPLSPQASRPEALDGFGLGSRPPSGSGRPAVACCRQLREMGSQSYPNWFNAMSVLKRFEDGLELAHELSSGDPRYDPAGTEEKFGMAAADMPATCATFRMNAPELCEGCAYAALVKSPVQTPKLAPSLQTAEPEILSATEPAENEISERPFAIPDWTAEDGTVELRFDEDDDYDVSPAGMQWKHWTGSGKKAAERTDLLCHAKVRYVRGETFYDETMRPLRAPNRQMLLVSWCGLRGAASIVFAIMAVNSVPPSGMEFDIFSMVFLVVLFSIIIQGSLLPAAAKKLGMIDTENDVMKTFTDYSDSMPVRFIQFTMPEDYKWNGREVRNITLPPDTRLVLIQRTEKNKLGIDVVHDIVPRRSTVIKPGDRLTLSAKSPVGTQDVELTERTAEKWHDGRTVGDIFGDRSELVVLIERGIRVIIPNGNTVVKTGDRLVLYSQSEKPEK